MTKTSNILNGIRQLHNIPMALTNKSGAFTYIITKNYHHRANSDVGFMMVAFNLWRLINIISAEGFNPEHAIKNQCNTK